MSQDMADTIQIEGVSRGPSLTQIDRSAPPRQQIYATPYCRRRGWARYLDRDRAAERPAAFAVSCRTVPANRQPGDSTCRGHPRHRDKRHDGPEGRRIRFLGSTLVPDDEICYSLFDANTADDVRHLMERAALPCQHPSHVLQITPRDVTRG